MNYRTMVKGALALSLSLTVASAFAASTTYNDEPLYGATFESAVSTVAPLNDYAYQLGSGITNQLYRDEQAAKGWFATGGDSPDESKIIERVVDNETQQALQLNTDANTLTNKFASDVAGAVNTALANEGTAFFETEVKFVASDTLDAGIAGGQDATKFAIYAYCDETDQENITTNLVVFHAYYDGEGEIAYTNEAFKGVNIDTEVYTKLRIEMKQMKNASLQDVNVFAVKVGNGDALTSDTALDAYLDGTPGAVGSWFLTVEDSDDSDNIEVSSLNFKGTGEIDNISVGTIAATTEYAIDWTDSVNVVVSNNNAQLTADQTNFVAGAVLTFYPTEGAITNVNGEAVANLASYEYTVGTTDTNLVVLAGEEPATPTYAVSWTVDKVVVSNTTDAAAIVEAVAGSFEAGTKLTFYPEEGTITNLVVNGSPVDPLPAGAYEYTMLAQADQTIVAKAGSEPVGRILPEWAKAADATKFWTWVDKYSVQYATDYTAQYLMNVDPSKTPVLKIDSIVVTDEGSQIVVSATDGTNAIDLDAINGVLNVSVGSSLANLASKDPDANATFADNKATIIIKATDGAFAKATVDFTAAADKLSQVSQ